MMKIFVVMDIGIVEDFVVGVVDIIIGGRRRVPLVVQAACRE